MIGKIKQLKFSKFIPDVFREDADYSIGERAIALLCLTLAALSIFIGIPLNFFISASLEIHIINIVGIILLLAIYYVIKFQKIAPRHLWILFIPMNLVLVFAYFQEEGAQGPILMFWLTFAYFYAAIEQKTKYLLLGIGIIMITALVFFDLNNPGLVQYYLTRDESILNNYLVTVICTITIFVLVSYLIYLNIKERQKILVQNRMIEAQNKQIMELSAFERDMNNMKLDFYTHVSHEVRTPLTLISAPLQNLLKKETDEDKRKYLERIDQNVHKIHNLIDQVMDLRKMDVNELELHASRNDMVSFIGRITRSFADLAESAQVKLSFDSEWSELPLMFDKIKMERVLVNLISNALKYTPKDGEVRVSLGHGNGTVKIIIQDTGKGMEEKYLTQIFHPFYQVPETRTGTGLGLTIVKEYVQLHKGTVNVDSQVGQGTRFTIDLPFDLYNDVTTHGMDEAGNDGLGPHSYGMDMDQFTPKEQPNSQTGSEPPPKKYTLLIIDDNKDIIDYLEEEFSGKYNILTAYNGESGLAKAKKHQPDIVITDVMMPVMDGIECCKRLKSEAGTSHIPVILLTAKTAEAHQVEGYDTGADDYITKPFSMDVLDARIRNIIAQRENLHKLFASSLQEVKLKDMTPTTQDQEFMEKAYRLIRNNLDDQDFGVAEMVEQMNVSRSLLHIKLKKLVNLSTSEFIMIVRLRSAAKLMRDTTRTISQISYDVGFSDPTYFTKMFKKFFNQTPKEYRS